MGKIRHCGMEGAGPLHYGRDLAQREYLGVDVDDATRKVVQDLAAHLVESEHSGNVRDASREVVQKRVHGWGPESGRTPYGVADAHGAADVPAGQPFLVGPPYRFHWSQFWPSLKPART